MAVCTAPSCSGSTPRVVCFDPIHTVYGDVRAAEDDPSHSNVYDPLVAFLLRNTS